VERKSLKSALHALDVFSSGRFQRFSTRARN
jgi:hypothetical protein